MLTEPEPVLQEQRRLGEVGADPEEVERLESEMASLRNREERLVRLFGYDEVDTDVVRSEFRQLRSQRELLAEAMDALPWTLDTHKPEPALVPFRRTFARPTSATNPY